MEQGIYLERQGPIARIVLNRPAKRNAMTAAMWRAIPALCAEIAADPEALVVVLTGAGGKAFSAGADIAEFPEVYETPESTRAYNEAVEAAQEAIVALDRPTIAAISGACVGGGCGLALASDFRFATEDARFAIPPATLGLAYSFNATRRLVGKVGPSRAKDMLFSGRLIAADEALRIGLVDRVVPAGALDQTVAAYAERLASVSQYTIRTMMRMVDAITLGADAPTPDLAEAWAASFTGADFAEGYRAFMEKRSPVFRWR